MTSVLSRLGNNFLVAAFIPALGFVIAAELLFAPLDPAGSNSVFSPPRTLEEGILTVVLALIAGFTMMGLITFNYKLLEGYMVLERFPTLQRRQYRKALRRLGRYSALLKLRKEAFSRYDAMGARELIEHPHRRSSYENLLESLDQRLREVAAAYKEDYPVQIEGSVLPTRFGNVFKSAELYPNENYGIDSVRLWPRLIHVIAPSYDARLDASNNNLAFLVNCMAFCFLLAALCLLASLWHLLAADQTTLLEPVPNGATRFGLASILFVGLGYFFYHVALPAARQYNNLVRSAFDLFRFDLLTELKVDLPADNDAELRLWTQISDFIAVSNLARPENKVNLSYTHSSPQHEGSLQTGTLSANAESDRSSQEDDSSPSDLA